MNSPRFYYKLFAVFVLNFAICMYSNTILLKYGINSQDEEILELKRKIENCDQKNQASMMLLDDLRAKQDKLIIDLKNNKEESSRISVKLASLLEDMKKIKSMLRVPEESLEEVFKKLTSEKRAFIESFEKLIKDGAPFSSFLDSNNQIIDIKRYINSSNLIKLKDVSIKSTEELKKEFVAIGNSLFPYDQNESFWKKQLNLFKNKLLSAIQFNNDNDNIKGTNYNLKDRDLFEKASIMISNGNFEKIPAILKQIKNQTEDLKNFIAEIEKRITLNKAFQEFKKEFIETEILAEQNSSAIHSQ